MRLILFHSLVTLGILVVYCHNFDYQTQYKKPDGLYEINWSVKRFSHSIQIQICKRIKNYFILPNWMGIGFSDRGEMENADLFAVDLRNNHGFDMHTDGYGRIFEDIENNYKLLEVLENDEEICFSMERKFDTCDAFDYLIDRGTTNILIFTSNITFHDLQGMKFNILKPFQVPLQLIRSTIPISNVSSFTSQMDILVNEVEIPSTQTTYWCKVVKLPKLKKKHHIIKYEAVIGESSQGIVHHMELFHCNTSPSNRMKGYNAPCNSESKPMGLTMCRKVIAAWAMGASAFTYPKEVGNPIGGPGFSEYAILEIHYNNQEEKRGIIDNSGLRLFYTENLRKFDSGILELGLEYNAKNSIPPGQREFKLSGFCLNECTKKALPRDGIFIFGSQLHTHLTGIRVETRHFRRNRELKPLNTDSHYQPHYQEIRLLPEIINLLPGDTLITSCTYNTFEKKGMTFGGISITNEMCLNYVFYYPRIELELCKSSVSDYALELLLNKPLDNLEDVFNEIQWNKRNSDILEEFYKIAPIHQSCNMSDSLSYKGFWDPLVLPRVPVETSKLFKENAKCLIDKLIKQT